MKRYSCFTAIMCTKVTLKRNDWEIQAEHSHWLINSLFPLQLKGLGSCKESCRMHARPVVGGMSGKQRETWANMACLHTRHSFSCTNKMTMARADLATWLHWLHYCCITSTFWWRTLEKVHPSWAQAAFKTSSVGVCSALTHTRLYGWKCPENEWRERRRLLRASATLWKMKSESKGQRSRRQQTNFTFEHQATPPYFVLRSFGLHVVSTWCVHWKADWPLRR